jgi:hypothetical protein
MSNYLERRRSSSLVRFPIVSVYPLTRLMSVVRGQPVCWPLLSAELLEAHHFASPRDSLPASLQFA